jgi:integrase
VEGILAENVARNLRLNYRYRPTFVAWTPAEARKFLRVAESERLGALYTAALLLGIRRGEALGLAWSDVDLERGVLEVRQALQRAGGVLRLGPVKSDGSARFVAIPAPCVDALRRHRARQAAERAVAGEAWRESGLVFTSVIGSPVEPANVNKEFAALCAKAGVRRIRFHDLRHSCATMLYELGVPIENIQDVLGHSTPGNHEDAIRRRFREGAACSCGPFRLPLCRGSGVRLGSDWGHPRNYAALRQRSA